MKESFQGRWLGGSSLGINFFDLCEQIVSNETLFKTFKTNPHFTRIIGNDIRSSQEALKWYNNIKDNGPLLEKLGVFKTNDEQGSPPLHTCDNIGLISTGTLYFLNILNDLLLHFGDIRNLDIVEIGSGYGGQAKILLDWGVRSYTCVDHPKVLSLCQKYLQPYNYPNTIFMSTEDIKERSYDLVISNWCLSEFDFKGINYYLNEIIIKCRSGYFLMNVWDGERKSQIISLFQEKFKNVVVKQDRFTIDIPDNWLMVINS